MVISPVSSPSARISNPAHSVVVNSPRPRAARLEREFVAFSTKTLARNTHD